DGRDYRRKASLAACHARTCHESGQPVERRLVSAMKGEEKLWSILNDKLDTLRAGNRLPEAIRVAETALDLAKRTFAEDESSLALSYEKLGQLLEQHGDRATA